MPINWGSYLSKLFDPYDLKARLFPGLLILSPVILFVVLNFGSKNPILTLFATILATCGGPYLLASFIRTWGQRAQTKLYEKWSAQPTTILLRHRNERLATHTKLHYHQLIQTVLNVPMPNPEQEAKNPSMADQSYAAAADALRPLTNDKKRFPFVFKELVSYGFNRNAYGSKWVGCMISIFTIVAILTREDIPLDHLLSNPEYFLNISLANGITLTISVIMLLVWVFHFTPKTVEFSGYSYALRLFEALKELQAKPKRERKKSIKGIDLSNLNNNGA